MSDYRKLSLFLLRHGECEGGEMVRGRTDVALSERGLCQMRQGWQHLSAPVSAFAPGRLWLASSPARRCTAFANELVGQGPFVGELQLCHWAREMDFGLWDGLPQSEVYRRWPELASAFWRDPLHHSPPQGEPLPDFCQRVRQGWQAWVMALSNSKADGGLLVCHGGVIRALLSHILQPDQLPGAPWFTSFDLPYGAGVAITVYLADECPPFYQLHWPGSLMAQ